MRGKVYQLFSYFHKVCDDKADARSLCRELETVIGEGTVRGSQSVFEVFDLLPENIQTLIKSEQGNNAIFTLFSVIQNKYSPKEAREVSADLVELMETEGLDWTDPIARLEVFGIEKIVKAPSLFKTILEILLNDSEKRIQFALKKIDEFMIETL